MKLESEKIFSFPVTFFPIFSILVLYIRQLDYNAMYTDERLMLRLAAGELDAATHLFRQHNKALFNFFLYHNVPHQGSEDLVQTVFERIIRYKHTYREGMSFRTWLYQIARNVLSDQYKQQNRVRHADIFAPDASHIWFHVADQDDMEHEEKLMQLEQALRQLPPEHLEILLLTRYQKLKYHEVADILECSVDAVKQRVFRATQRLREAYFRLNDR